MRDKGGQTTVCHGGSVLSGLVIDCRKLTTVFLSGVGPSFSEKKKKREKEEID